jgi:hypothetical protein
VRTRTGISYTSGLLPAVVKTLTLVEVAKIAVVTSPLHSLTWVFGEQTAQAGEIACYRQLSLFLQPT